MGAGRNPTASGNVFVNCTATKTVLIERAGRTVGDGRSLRQHTRAADDAVLEGHQHRLGRREHGFLELRGILSDAKTARQRRTILLAISASMRWFPPRGIRPGKVDTSSRSTGMFRPELCI